MKRMWKKAAQLKALILELGKKMHGLTVSELTVSVVQFWHEAKRCAAVPTSFFVQTNAVCSPSHEPSPGRAGMGMTASPQDDRKPVAGGRTRMSTKPIVVVDPKESQNTVEEPTATGIAEEGKAATSRRRRRVRGPPKAGEKSGIKIATETTGSNRATI